MPRQAKTPSLAQNLLMLGDVYFALGWLAVQRLRHGPLWPWDARSKRPGWVVALPRPDEEGQQEREAVIAKKE
jgi:hypothetical protein